PSVGTPTKEMIIHGREHLLEQLSIIKPDIAVLLGNTACIAMLDRKIEISKMHGTLLEKDGRKYFVTFHPAYAMRFPDGRRGFIRDFSKLKKFIMASRS
ncbi:MAG TPA: uracil-DNA glycosylase family protein, partial [Nitrospirota bacterium]